MRRPVPCPGPGSELILLTYLHTNAVKKSTTTNPTRTKNHCILLPNLRRELSNAVLHYSQRSRSWKGGRRRTPKEAMKHALCRSSKVSAHFRTSKTELWARPTHFKYLG